MTTTRKFLTLVVCVILSTSVAPQEAAAQSATIPPDGKTLVIVGQDLKTIEEYCEHFDTPAGFMVYTSIQELDGLFDVAPDRGAGIHHAQKLIDQYPDTVIQIGLYLVDALDGIIRGEYDGQIQKLGRWIYDVNRPVYLRIGYEFDLPQNNYDPKLYKDAYRYIVNALWWHEADNISYVWHSYGKVNPAKPMMDWYPGDKYVDWFAVSFFNPYHLGDLEFVAARAKEHGKPLMIAESTPYQMPVQNGDGTWKKWFERYFNFIEKNDVKAICYINSHWDNQPMFKGQNWGDARLQENFYIKTKWIDELHKERYLLSSEELFDTLKNE